MKKLLTLLTTPTSLPLGVNSPRRRVSWKSLAWLTGSLIGLLFATGGIGQSGSSAFRLTGLWPGYLRGDVTCVATDGRHAYVGLTLAGPGGCERGWRGRLEVMDVSDPARPVWVGGLNFRDPIRRIQVASNQVYIASGQTLQVLTVTNPSLPVLLGKWEANDEIKSFQLKDSCLYVLRYSALDVLEVTNPAQPALVGSRSGDFWGGASVQVTDHFAYVAAGGGLRIFEASDPSQPVLLASTNVQDASAVDVAGGYAYVATAEGLKVISLSNPSQPTPVATNALGAGARGVWTAGAHCYLTVGKRLEVLDITNPIQPTSVGGYDTGADINDLALAGHYALVAARAEGLHILEVSDPAHPALVATRETGGPTEAVQVVGHYAYLADGNSGLQVIDLANTNGLVRVGQYKTTNYARAVQVVGTTAYVAAGSGLQIIDVSNPALPTRIGSLALAPGQEVKDVQVVGNLAYLAAGALEIIEVSTPGQPIQVTNCTAVYSVRAVNVVGQFAYVAGGGAGGDGLTVIDVSDPAHPQPTGFLATGAFAQDVQVVGNRAYVIVSWAIEDPETHTRSWLQIIDVGNPSQPILLGQCPISEEARAVQVVGRYAYIAGGSWVDDAPGWHDGLLVMDVGDPAHPKRVGGVSTPGWAAGVQVVGDWVYLADGPAGLAVVSLPTAPLAIVEEPQSQPVFYGSPGTLSVGAYSLSPIHFQWYLGQSGDTSQPVAGATNVSCIFTAVTQNATAWVRVSSGTNSFDTPSATLTLVPIAVWGDTNYSLTHAPEGLTNPVAIAAGDYHSLALTAEGRVVAWGAGGPGTRWPNFGQTQVPSNLNHVVAIAAGRIHSLALTDHGEVVGWGYSDNGQTNVPGGLSNVVAIAAGGDHGLALTANGQVVGWGANGSGQTTVPSGLNNVVAIAAEGNHSLALTAQGQVVAWGDNSYGQTNVPWGLSNVVALAAGGSHSLALTAEGRVVAWGDNGAGQTTLPSGLSNVVAIAAGGDHGLALTAEGQLVAWGRDDNGQTNVPRGLSNAVALAAGGDHSMALLGLPSAWIGPRFLIATVDRSFHHRMIAGSGATYGAAGLPAGLVLDPNTGLITGLPTQAGTYSVVLSATNSARSSTWTVALFVNEPAAPGIASSGLVQATLGRAFNYVVVAYNAPEWYGANGLPTGLAIDAQSGIISGVPTEAGDFSVSLMASNRYGLGTASLTIWVTTPPPPTISSSGLEQATLGLVFNYAVVAYNGPEWYGASGLPPGLAIDAQSGMISGVPTAVGDFAVSLLASNRYGLGTGTLNLRVVLPPPVIGWGCNWSGEISIPNGLSNVVAIAAEGNQSLVLASEGRVVGWGYHGFAQTNMPNGLSNVVAVAAGGRNLALTADGQVMLIGHWSDQTNVPSGLSNVVAIAAGGDHSLALTAEGQVVAWGNNSYGQTNVPSGLSNVVAITAGSGYSLALTTEGQVVGWGRNNYGQTSVPIGLSHVVAISAGWDHSLALTAQDQVVAWGRNDYGQTTVPSGLSNVVAVAAGALHNLALTAEGKVVAWGNNENGQTTVPNDLSNVVAIAAGGAHSLALRGFPPALFGPRFLVATADRPFHHRVIAGRGATYGVTGLPPGLVLNLDTGLITGQPEQTGRFSLVISATNSARSSIWTVTLFVNEPAAPAVANSGMVMANIGFELNYAVVAYNAPDWYEASGLPPGLVIDPRSGVISGTPTELGDFTVNLVATNRQGLGAGSLTVRVSIPPPVVAWGFNSHGQSTVPSDIGNVVAIAAGESHSLALRPDGRVVGWGRNDHGQTTPPGSLSNVVAIAAGPFQNLALTAEGRVVAWGGNSNAPSTLCNVVAIESGGTHSLALMADGQVVAWGDNGYGQTTVPSGLSYIVAIAAGEEHSVALTAEGRVVAWGRNNYG